MDDTKLGNLPGIHIPCESEEALRTLTKLLYEKEILSEESVKFVNVSSGFYEKLNEESVKYKIGE